MDLPTKVTMFLTITTIIVLGIILFTPFRKKAPKYLPGTGKKKRIGAEVPRGDRSYVVPNRIILENAGIKNYSFAIITDLGEGAGGTETNARRLFEIEYWD
ncbi:MAG: hypothetical protein QG583_245 [Patescibacteria group bacterium]|nr:hypothetical protein [Patescibacteria group bacterium]